MKTYYSVIIPVYNEENNLPELYRRLVAIFKSLDKPYEIVFVDDGSVDRSAKILARLARGNSRVKVITLSRNFGQQAAVTAGLENCSGEIITTMDADLQDPPELLPKLLSKIATGYDVVYGVSATRRDPPLRKFLFNSYYWLMERLSSYPLPQNVGIFAVMRRPIVETLLTLGERNRWLPALRSWVGFRQIGISYEKPARFSGRSPQTVGKLFKMGFDALFSFSYLPLRLATILGLIVTLLVFFVGLDVLYQKFVAHTAITGWSGPMLSIVIIGGAQLIILGIIGEYLGRIYDEVKRRPFYIISQKHGF
ncbi:glycosyltransferase family 2 protein [Candidatus Microgenomates bacterium]|nr:glycosyltransferase family 2 protein [Candidatus Microgenomates bacterium]